MRQLCKHYHIIFTITLKERYYYPCFTKMGTKETELRLGEGRNTCILKHPYAYHQVPLHVSRQLTRPGNLHWGRLSGETFLHTLRRLDSATVKLRGKPSLCIPSTSPRESRVPNLKGLKLFLCVQNIHSKGICILRMTAKRPDTKHQERCLRHSKCSRKVSCCCQNRQHHPVHVFFRVSS